MFFERANSVQNCAIGFILKSSRECNYIVNKVLYF
jgi:hypothetical protein